MTWLHAKLLIQFKHLNVFKRLLANQYSCCGRAVTRSLEKHIRDMNCSSAPLSQRCIGGLQGFLSLGALE